ncbi:MAG: GyrI-like domain-containing protein [Thermoplasmata archaeon]|nr:MAG: GyrI-like domain-containing protein [Thermoplasmata archaeon]
MGGIDLKRELADLYKAPRKPVMVDVPSLRYAMVDGTGNPNDNEWFQEATGALYAVSYTLKFKLKKGPSALNYVVMPLQGLWWAEDMEVFVMDAREEWLWTLMILQPEEVTPEMFNDACQEVLDKKGLEAVNELRLEEYHEGPSAQVMHLGPYAEEAPTIAMLHEYIEDSGRVPRGKHHEIYLGDPRRTAPERLKTILRQPVGEP